MPVFHQAKISKYESHCDLDMQDVNLERGSCSGTIEAGGQEDEPVKTYWTGTEQDQAYSEIQRGKPCCDEYAEA